MKIIQTKSIDLYRSTERRRRTKEVSVAYKGGKCRKCGYDRCIAALEFHHVNPEKKEYFITGKSHSINWEELKKELDKCVLLCGVCHREAEAKMFDCTGMQEYNAEVFPEFKDYFCAECEKRVVPSGIKCRNCYARTANARESVTNKIEKEDLVIMFTKNNSTYNDIADKYNVSQGTIRNWCKFHNLPTTIKAWNEYKKEKK